MTKEELLKSAVLPNQEVNVILNHYEVTLGVSAVDTENKVFNSKNIGTYNIVTSQGMGNNHIIAQLKKIYPELTIYRNIVVLDRKRENLILTYKLDDLIKKEKEGK